MIDLEGHVILTAVVVHSAVRAYMQWVSPLMWHWQGCLAVAALDIA